MLYRYTHAESPLKEVEIVLGSRKPQALIYAPDDLAPEKLVAIRDGLDRKGYLTLIDRIDGRDALRVERIGSREKFLGELEREHLVAGAPTMVETPRDKALVRSFREKLGENTKTASGYGYLATDATLALSGLLRGDRNEAMAGVLWGTTGIALALFGKKDPDTQTGVLYAKLDEHLKREGIEFPTSERALLDALKRDDTLVNAVADFFYEHVSDFHHAIQAVGGVKLAQAGLAQENNYKAVAGGLVAVGQSMGMMPEHDKKTPSHRPAAYENGKAAAPAEPTPLPATPEHYRLARRGWDWFNSNPLHYAGFLPFANNVLGVTGALRVDRKRYHDATGPIGKVAFEARDREVLRLKGEQVALGAEAAHVRTPAYLELEEKIAATIQRHEPMERLARAGLRVPEGVPLAGGKVLAPHHLTIGIAVGYMISNLLYAFSPKNAPCDLGRTGHLEEIEATIANIAAKQPDSFATAFINRIAGELAKNQDVGKTADELATAILAKEEGIKQSHWARRIRSEPPAASPALA